MSDNGPASKAMALRDAAPITAATFEQVIIGGDLKGLTPAQRTEYYNAVCQSLGVNPLTRPFEYIYLNNKLVLYARRDCTDQLRRKHAVNVSITARELVEDVYIVTARATMPDGRTDESIGAVAVAGKKGDDLANAYMKAESKSKRRVTLSIVGLGWLDETEVETIPGAQVVNPDAPVPQTSGEPAQKITRQELMRRFGDLHLEAVNLGLPHIDHARAQAEGVVWVEDVNDDTPTKEIARRGGLLKQIVNDYKSHPAAVEGEIVEESEPPEGGIPF